MSEFQNTGKIEKRLDGTTWYDQDYVDNLQQENKHLNLQLDQALKDYEELLIKIDKAIDFINEWEKYTKEKRPLEVSMLDLLYIKEILGEKEK